jgi:hypothetical protein
MKIITEGFVEGDFDATETKLIQKYLPQLNIQNIN